MEFWMLLLCMFSCSHRADDVFGGGFEAVTAAAMLAQWVDAREVKCHTSGYVCLRAQRHFLCLPNFISSLPLHYTGFDATVVAI